MTYGTKWDCLRNKGTVRRVSENPVDYAILDIESALLSGATQKEVRELMEGLRCISEAQYLVHPKSYDEF